MKKVILIAALAIVSVANAQKGSFLLMGSVGFNSQKNSNGTVPAPSADTEQKVNTFSFAPKVGYQFSDHMTVGIEGSVSSSKTETNTTVPFGPGTVTATSENKGTAFFVGPFLRYSQSLSDIFAMYADLGVGYQSQKSTTSATLTQSTSNKGNGIYAGITPNLFINIKKGFGVNIGFGGLGYETIKYDDIIDPTTGGGTVDHKVNQFVFTFGSTFNVGISKNF